MIRIKSINILEATPKPRKEINIMSWKCNSSMFSLELQKKKLPQVFWRTLNWLAQLSDHRCQKKYLTCKSTFQMLAGKIEHTPRQGSSSDRSYLDYSFLDLSSSIKISTSHIFRGNPTNRFYDGNYSGMRQNWEKEFAILLLVILIKRRRCRWRNAQNEK